MSAAAKWEIYDQLRITDPPPELREQWKWLVERLVELDPSAGEKIEQRKARKALREVLAARGFTPSASQEVRIDGCTDVTTLDRWLRQAVTAASVDEALA